MISAIQVREIVVGVARAGEFAFAWRVRLFNDLLRASHKLHCRPDGMKSIRGDGEIRVEC